MSPGIRPSVAKRFEELIAITCGDCAIGGETIAAYTQAALPG